MSIKRETKQKQIKALEILLLLTGIAGVLIIGGYAYLSFHSSILASADGTHRDSMYGTTVVLFASVIAAAYSLINFKNLLHLDKDGLATKHTRNDFIAKTSVFNTSSQGIMVANIFTLVYWLIYSSALNIKYYVADGNKLVDLTAFTYAWEGAMILTVVLSIFTVKAAHTLSKKWK